MQSANAISKLSIIPLFIITVRFIPYLPERLLDMRKVWYLLLWFCEVLSDQLLSWVCQKRSYLECQTLLFMSMLPNGKGWGEAIISFCNIPGRETCTMSSEIVPGAHTVTVAIEGLVLDMQRWYKHQVILWERHFTTKFTKGNGRISDSRILKIELTFSKKNIYCSYVTLDHNTS